MPELDRLLFSAVRDTHPDRWEKARPGAAFVNKHDEVPGRFTVRRQGGEWHECVLVVAHGEFFGTCDCQGFEFHDGPCSHLCALYRLHADDPDYWHRPAVDAIRVDLQSDDQRRAQLHAEPEQQAATDGGRRL